MENIDNKPLGFQNTETWGSFVDKRGEYEAERDAARVAFIEYLMSYVWADYQQYLQGDTTPWRDDPNDGPHESFIEYLMDAHFSGNKDAWSRYYIPDFEETIMALYEDGHEFSQDVNIYLMSTYDTMQGQAPVAYTVLNRDTGQIEMTIR